MANFGSHKVLRRDIHEDHEDHEYHEYPKY